MGTVEDRCPLDGLAATCEVCRSNDAVAEGRTTLPFKRGGMSTDDVTPKPHKPAAQRQTTRRERSKPQTRTRTRPNTQTDPYLAFFHTTPRDPPPSPGEGACRSTAACQ